jgi:hypothetical protein
MAGHVLKRIGASNRAVTETFLHETAVSESGYGDLAMAVAAWGGRWGALAADVDACCWLCRTCVARRLVSGRGSRQVKLFLRECDVVANDLAAHVVGDFCAERG